VATSFVLGEGETNPLMGEEEPVASTLGIVARCLTGLALVGIKESGSFP
jgi:hypothetical protein